MSFKIEPIIGTRKREKYGMSLAWMKFKIGTWYGRVLKI